MTTAELIAKSREVTERRKELRRLLDGAQSHWLGLWEAKQLRRALKQATHDDIAAALEGRTIDDLATIMSELFE